MDSLRKEGPETVADWTVFRQVQLKYMFRVCNPATDNGPGEE